MSNNEIDILKARLAEVEAENAMWAAAKHSSAWKERALAAEQKEVGK